MSTSHSRLSIAALSLAAAATVLTGCSGSSSDSATSDVRSSASAGAQAVTDAQAPASAASSAAEPRRDAAVEASAQKLARRASIALEVRDIAEATARVRSINSSAQGFILSENIGSTGRAEAVEGVNPTTYAAISISVPSDRLDATLDDLQQLGKVLDRRSETENVTAEYVDTAARVTSMKKSVARIQDLVGQTDDINQLVKLENELSSRQADLEAVEARLQEMERTTSRSPITITMTTTPTLIKDVGDDDDGFTGGLRSGWEAFVASLVALLTVLGALLPFALFALLVGYPALVLWRRWSARRRAAWASPAAGPAPSPASATPDPAPVTPEHAGEQEGADHPVGAGAGSGRGQ